MHEINNIINELPKHNSSHYQTRALDQIDTIVIHHSATPIATTAYSIAVYHVSYKRWPGIGYHFIVTNDGSILQTNDLKTSSTHAGGHNHYSIGICLIGNFMDEPPPHQQLEAAAALVSHLRDQLGTLSIQPHKHLNQTPCPGATWDSWFLQLDQPVEKPPIRSTDLTHLYEELVQTINLLQTTVLALGEILLAQEPSAD